MKISRLPDRLDRMPMLKILVFFAAGIALADRYELPLWFLAGAFVVTGVLALSLRSSAATAAMILTAGFAAAQFRAPRATVPRGVHTVYEVTVEGFPADRGRYAVADASVAAWRDPADGRWHASDARIRLYADSLAGLHAGERIRCRGAVRPFRGGAESYRRLMARRGYAGTLWIAERTLLERLPGRHAGLHRRAVERLSRLPMSAGAAAVVEAMAAGEAYGVQVIPGMEITSREEVHILGYFSSVPEALAAGEAVYAHLPQVLNQPALFGNQIIIGADDSPSGTLEKLLINATDLSVEEVCALVRAFGGVPVPAHINRGSNGMIGALGLMPFLPDYPVVEVYPGVPCPAYATKGRFVIHSSDAHRLEDLQERTFSLDTQPTARDVMRLLRALDGRQIPQNGI